MKARAVFYTITVLTGMLLTTPEICAAADVGVDASAYNKLDATQKAALTNQLKSAGLIGKKDTLRPELGFSPTPKPDTSSLPKDSKKALCARDCVNGAKSTVDSTCKARLLRSVKDYCVVIVEAVGNQCATNCLK